MSLYRLINMFFSDLRSDSILNNLAHESFMNLWCVDAAFHVILFNLDPLLGGKQQFARLRVGIDTWEAVWNHRLRNNDERFFDPIITTAANQPWARDDPRILEETRLLEERCRVLVVGTGNARTYGNRSRERRGS